MDKVKLLDFSDIADSLKEAYKQIVLKKNKKFKWTGPLLKRSSGMLASCPNIDSQLMAENLKYNKEEQGRSEIETLLGCAVQLGIQQGVDMAFNNNSSYIGQLESNIKMIELLLKSKDSEKEIKTQLEFMRQSIEMYKTPFKDREKEE